MRHGALPLLVLLACSFPAKKKRNLPPADPTVPGAWGFAATALGCEPGLYPSLGVCCAVGETWSPEDWRCQAPVPEIPAAGVSARQPGSRRDDPILGRFYWVPGAELWMMEHEVTQGQWLQVMGENPSYFAGCGPDCPVEQVSWHDVQRFLAQIEALVNVRYDLPTEAQWVLAARAGEDFLFAGSDEIEAVAWFGENSDGRTHPVCQKQRNSLGLCDMTGNVMEWTNTIDNNFRIDRGGHFDFNVYDSRIAHRDGNDSYGRSHRLGFRLVLVE